MCKTVTISLILKMLNQSAFAIVLSCNYCHTSGAVRNVPVHRTCPWVADSPSHQLHSWTRWPGVLWGGGGNAVLHKPIVLWGGHIA